MNEPGGVVGDGSPTGADEAAVVQPLESLAEFRSALHDLHHEIENIGGRSGDLLKDAFEATLWLAIDYLLPDFDPLYEVTIRRKPRG